MSSAQATEGDRKREGERTREKVQNNNETQLLLNTPQAGLPSHDINILTKGDMLLSVICAQCPVPCTRN